MIASVLAILAIPAVGAAIWFIGARYLRGADQSRFDRPSGDAVVERFSSGAALNAEHLAVIAALGGIAVALKGVPRERHLAVLRDYMDKLPGARRFDVQFVPTVAAGVAAEWVLAPGADSARRTLYIHGGAFTMGSPRSHRVITSKFAEITGGAVLAVDYRLMPEYPRQAGIEDCRSAYRWMLEHGPEGAAPAEVVFVAGDSAGANLTLALLAWLRDEGLRAPDAAVVLSPTTDATLSSPSIQRNLATDVMLAPLFRPLLRLPRSLVLWGAWLQNRRRPSHPLISPLFGDLSRLPPLLVQASTAEMLLDDSRRYVNKAVAAGSPVRLQTWDHVVHAWHLYDPQLTESRQAFVEIGKFLAAVRPRAAAQND